MIDTIKNTDSELSYIFIKSQLDKALIPPVVRPNPPEYYWPAVDDFTMSCGMAQTPKGRIWLAWFAGGDNEKAVILLASSDDEGKTFSKPRFILDPGYADCGIHISSVVGNLWTAPDGRLFFFFTVSLGYFDGRGGSWFSVCENPDSEHPVWGEAMRIGDGASLNKPTVLADGRWLLGVSLWTRDVIFFGAASKYLFPELDEQRMAHIYESRDQGASWTRISMVQNIYPSFDEHMIVERADGSLLMYLRSEGGPTYCESFDGGKSWTMPRLAPMPSASARFFLRKLASGNILLVQYASPLAPSFRSHLTAYLSEDGGYHWKGGLLLDERMDVSYPDGFQAEDGRIFIQYDRKRKQGEILLAVFREEDVLAGKPVSGDVILKHPVVQSWSAARASCVTGE